MDIPDIFSHGPDRTLFGAGYMQSHASLFLMEKILATFWPKRIVELGTGKGVLSIYFAVYTKINKKALFRTVDIRHVKRRDILELFKDTVFMDSENIRKPEAVQFYCDFLNQKENSLLLVDAGEPKSHDVNRFVPSLIPGTIVLAHDFNTVLDDPKAWGFKEPDVKCWDRLEKFQPYWDLSIKYNARLFCSRVIAPKEQPNA